MTPYYESKRVTLYLGDAFDVAASLPAKSVDLIVTDPPYGVNFRSNWSQRFETLMGDDGTLDVPALLSLALKALRPRRHVYVFGPDDLSALPLQMSPLIWDKGHVGMGNLSVPWGPQHEPITFGVYTPNKKDRQEGRGSLSARMRKGSVLRVSQWGGRGTTHHPTEKPVELMRQLIESSSVIGETVLDPFAGSGSTLIAATLTGRRAIGVELDEGYCEVAAKRLQAAEEIAERMEAA